MEDELKRKNNNSNNMNNNAEDIIQNNNNNNNNINHDTKKLVLTIKVNDETEPVNNNGGVGNENEKIIHVNGSTAIHIMTPPSAQAMPVLHTNGSSAISSIPINISNEEEFEYLNGVLVTNEVDDEANGEEFDFSSSDFEDAQEEVSAASDILAPAKENVNLVLPEPQSPNASSILQSPGPLNSSGQMDLTPDIIDVDTDRVSHRKSIDESEGQTEDDALISQFFGKANEIAEARLAARRQARAEAREIRMRELERQQKEQEQNADRQFDMQQQSSTAVDPIVRSRLTAANSLRANNNTMNSRRSSEDSVEEESRSLRDLRHDLKDVEERFRKAMITNAQLDNERASQTYQIQLLKDKLEDMEETYAQLQREYKEKCRDHDALKRQNDKLTEELRLTTGQLNERDTLIAEQGLTIVLIENEEGTDARRALVSVENAHLLGTVQGSLDVRLRRFAEEKSELQEEITKLRQQLNDTKHRGRRSGSLNGPMGDDEYEDAQREANKLLSEYKYKLQKAEQEIASLQASLARSETQVIRYKSTSEAAEKAEADLKTERRKLQRENREALERLEELETANNHLLKRLDKLKNAKSALLKDL